jgi:hypothetical protein
MLPKECCNFESLALEHLRDSGASFADRGVIPGPAFIAVFVAGSFSLVDYQPGIRMLSPH